MRMKTKTLSPRLIVFINILTLQKVNEKRNGIKDQQKRRVSQMFKPFIIYNSTIGMSKL